MSILCWYNRMRAIAIRNLQMSNMIYWPPRFFIVVHLATAFDLDFDDPCEIRIEYEKLPYNTVGQISQSHFDCLKHSLKYRSVNVVQLWSKSDNDRYFLR